MAKEKQDDIDFEIQFYEGLLKKKPDFLQNLIMLGELYTRKGWYEKGLLIDKKLAQMRPDDPVVLYNLACSYSLLKKIDTAFSAVKLAIQCGYSDFEHLECDADLDNLRNDPHFQKYWAKLKPRKKQKNFESRSSSNDAN